MDRIAIESIDPAETECDLFRLLPLAFVLFCFVCFIYLVNDGSFRPMNWTDRTESWMRTRLCDLSNEWFDFGPELELLNGQCRRLVRGGHS